MKEIIQGKKNSLNIGEKTPHMYFHVCLRDKWQWEAVVTQGNFQASTGPSFRRHAVISTPSTRKRPYQQNPPSDNHQRLQKIQIKTVTIAQLSPSHAMLHKRGNTVTGKSEHASNPCSILHTSLPCSVRVQPPASATADYQS